LRPHQKLKLLAHRLNHIIRSIRNTRKP
jgi:hypothetical protein